MVDSEDNKNFLDKSVVKKQSNKIASKFGLRWVYSPVTNRLLRLLGEGYPQAVIAEELNLSKQRVNYWAVKANWQGLVRVQTTKKIVDNRETSQVTSGNVKIYELTAFGQNFLTGSERGFCEPVTLEDYALKFPLVSDRSSLDWKKCGDPKNWKKMGVSLGSVFVEKCLGLQPSVIIHAGQFSGFTSEDLHVEAGGIIFATKALLQDKGVVLGDVGSPVRDPNVKRFTPEAALLQEKYGNITTDGGTIDASPPDKLAHEERNREQEFEYLSIPKMIREQGEKIEALTKGTVELKQEQAEAKKETVEFSERLKRIEADVGRFGANQERLCASQEKLVELFNKQGSFWEKLENTLTPDWQQPTVQSKASEREGRLYE